MDKLLSVRERLVIILFNLNKKNFWVGMSHITKLEPCTEPDLCWDWESGCEGGCRGSLSQLSSVWLLKYLVRLPVSGH